MMRVWVTHRFAGYHQWPDAPVERAYLRNRHRHLFHVKVTVSVAHDNRDVEFHDLLDSVAAACDFLEQPLGSCEMIAAALAKNVQAAWPGRRVSVEVSEDGECGAVADLW
jgi:hypothetical protein